MTTDDLQTRLGRIEGQLEGVRHQLDHAERSRHELRGAVQALVLQTQPLAALATGMQALERRVTDIENRETRRTWFGLGLATAGGGTGGFGIAKLLELWGGRS